jgi:hypothetical protein
LRDAIREEIVTKDYLRVERQAAKGDLIKWIAGLLLAQAALVTALVKPLRAQRGSSAKGFRPPSAPRFGKAVGGPLRGAIGAYPQHMSPQ